MHTFRLLDQLSLMWCIRSQNWSNNRYFGDEKQKCENTEENCLFLQTLTNRASCVTAMYITPIEISAL